MNITNLQKEPVYWLSGEKLNCTNLARTLLIGVAGETVSEPAECAKEPICSVGITFDPLVPTTTKNSAVFISKPSLAFCSSPMLKRMYGELGTKEAEGEKNLQAKSLLKLDEMLTAVTLYKLPIPKSFILQLSVHESNHNKNGLLTLQNILAFCLKTISGSQHLIVPDDEIERNIESLCLYSLAWLCSITRTLRLQPYMTRLEYLFMFNIKRFFKNHHAKRLCTRLSDSKTTKDFYYVLMFLCSIGVRRADPMDTLLKYLSKNHYIEAFRDCCKIFEEKPIGVSQSLTVTNAALQIREALNNYFKDDSQIVSITPEKTEASKVLNMVEVFLSWLIKIVSRTTAFQRSQMLRAIVCFDLVICEISCDSDNAYRKFLVTKFDGNEKHRCCRMSYSDLSEWLKYMVLLQLDQRNIHSKTEFYLYAAPSLYDFGVPPNLTFQTDGIDYLSYFLLESEFIRSSLHQTRPAIRKMREDMKVDLKLIPFINANEPFKNYIILCKELLDVVSAFYCLKTVQAVPQNGFKLA